MRVLLNLKPLKKYVPNFNYHYKVQGFVYSLLINTKYDKLHEKEKYKFFCFSNIFKSNHPGDNSWKFIISSPDEKFIEQIGYSLEKVIEYQLPIQLGELFQLESYEIFGPICSADLITGSPITVRIDKKRFEKVTNQETKFDEVYWRSEHPIELFIESVEKNVKEKFKEFTKSEITCRILEKFELKKQVSTKIRLGGSIIPIIGTLWKFKLSPQLSEDQAMFCAECGFGERNSMGFGFMNQT